MRSVWRSSSPTDCSIATKEGRMTEATAPARALEPMAMSAGEGEARWWGDGLAEVKATAADTNGQMTILEVTEPANKAAPLHVHHKEDEGFWILDGSATFEVGDQTIEARAGDYLLGPRDIPHRYTTGPNGCRMLFIFTPGGFEELLKAISRPAERRTPPPPEAHRPTPSEGEMEQIRAAIHAHGCELLQ
jgi:quercetin dioxygenase-like cupin family protein